MKKVTLFLFIIFLLLHIQFVEGQISSNPKMNWRFTIAPSFLIPPLEGLTMTNHIGFGITGESEYFFSKNISISIMAGLDYFPGSKYSYYPDDPNIPGFAKITQRGTSFAIIPIMPGITHYPTKWFFYSLHAGIALGGSQGSGINIGYEPAFGFLIPAGNNNLEIGVKYIFTNLRVKTVIPGIGGMIPQTDFGQGLGIAIGWKF